MKYISLIIIIAFASCSHKNFQYVEKNYDEKTSIYEKVDIEDLIKEPSKFHNKKIAVSAYFTVNRNETALYDRKGSSLKGIWLSFKGDLQDEKGGFLLKDDKIYNYDDGTVVIKGIFDKNNNGNLGLYAGTLNEISFFSNYPN